MEGSDRRILAPWETLAQDVICDVPRLRLVRETVKLQDGRIIDDYYQIVMGQAAVVAAQRRDGRYLLLRMYKHGARRAGLGFPGGGVNDGEDPLAAAQRELMEETGYSAAHWRSLGGYTVHSNQGCGFVHFFAARDAVQVAEPVADDLEPHEFVFLPREGVLSAVRDGGFLSMGHVCMATLALALPNG